MSRKSQYGPWAVITGASSGIGAEFARQLAGDHINLVLVARREQRLRELGDKLAREFGIEYRVVKADLSEPDFVGSIRKVTDSLDVGLVISNAGFGLAGPFLQHDVETLDQMLRLNVSAHMRLAHHFGARLENRHGGGLLFVSSTGATQGVGSLANYSAAKAYTVNLGEALNSELGKKGVHVTTLLPGPTETEMMDKIEADFTSMPMKPMSATQCVREGLRALDKNEPTHIAGRLNRMMARLTPRRTAVKLWSAMMEKVTAPALANEPAGLPGAQ